MKLVFRYFWLFLVICPVVAHAVQIKLVPHKVQIQSIDKLEAALKRLNVPANGDLLLGVDFDMTLAQSVLYVDEQPFYHYYPLRLISSRDWNVFYQDILSRIGFFPDFPKDHFNYRVYRQDWIPSLRNEVNKKAEGRSFIRYETVEKETAQIFQSLLSNNAQMHVLAKGSYEEAKIHFLRKNFFLTKSLAEISESHFIYSQSKANDIYQLIQKKAPKYFLFLDDNSDEIALVIRSLSQMNSSDSSGKVTRLIPVHYNHFHSLVTLKTNREIIVNEVQKLLKLLEAKN